MTERKLLDITRVYAPDEDRQARAIARLLSQAVELGRKAQRRQRAMRLMSKIRSRYKRARRHAC